ncbi:MAG: hypothetical protein QM516_03950 [Limnohabitans sp.]|nr:hypothetical protein [Limnohabitans sp.]
MDEINFQEKMNQILDRIRELPAGKSAETADTIDAATARRERVQSSVNELQEALDYLRLSVKYLVFDLEATRRENAYLRRMIEQSNRERERNQRPEEDRSDEGNNWE